MLFTKSGQLRMATETSHKLQAKGEAMEIRHPSYYKKLRQQRKATSVRRHANDMLDADNSQRFVENAKPQATSDKLQAQASKGRSSNKR